MSNTSSLLDLIDLPPLPQRIVRILLRKQPQSIDAILAELKSSDTSGELTRDIVRAAIKSLVERDILYRVPHLPFSYEVRMPQSAAKDKGSELWDKAGIAPEQEQADRQGSTTESPASEVTPRSTGRRTLPDAIWNRLEDKGAADTDGTSPDGKPRTGRLRDNLFDALE